MHRSVGTVGQGSLGNSENDEVERVGSASLGTRIIRIRVPRFKLLFPKQFALLGDML